MNTNTFYFDKLIQSIKNMTKHSQEEWKIIEGDDRRHNDVLYRARAMMKAASLQYRGVVTEATGTELKNLTANWSPKRMLSINRAFKPLCIELEDVEIWNKLRRHERKFIADAFRMI